VQSTISSFEVWICRHSILESSFSTFSSWDACQDALDVAMSDSSEKFSSKAFPWGMRGYVNQMRYVVGASFFWNLGSWINLYIGIATLFNATYFMNRSFDTSELLRTEFKQKTPDNRSNRWKMERRSVPGFSEIQSSAASKLYKWPSCSKWTNIFRIRKLRILNLRYYKCSRIQKLVVPWSEKLLKSCWA